MNYHRPARLYTRTIEGFDVPMGSGLAVVKFTDGNNVAIESGTGLRSFVSAFGSLQQARGKTIQYSVDEHAVMEGFDVVETPPPPRPIQAPRFREPTLGRAFP